MSTGSATSRRRPEGHSSSSSVDSPELTQRPLRYTEKRPPRRAAECILLGAWSGRFQSQFLHHHLQVFPGFFFLARIAQQKRRMISDRELCSAEVVPAATQLGHWSVDG